MSNLKNYTSKSTHTFDKMNQILAQHGARKIMFEYDGMGKIQGINFTLMVNNVERGIKLPARIDKVEIAMYGTNNLDEKQRDQAYRTAWANIRDWIDAQMAMLDTGMVIPLEIFLPFMIVNSIGQTVYEKAEENNFMLPEPK